MERLFRKTLDEEKPFLLFGGIMLAVFHDTMGETTTLFLVVFVVAMCTKVYLQHERELKKRREQLTKDSKKK